MPLKQSPGSKFLPHNVQPGTSWESRPVVGGVAPLCWRSGIGPGPWSPPTPVVPGAVGYSTGAAIAAKAMALIGVARGVGASTFPFEPVCVHVSMRTTESGGWLQASHG